MTPRAPSRWSSPSNNGNTVQERAALDVRRDRRSAMITGGSDVLDALIAGVNIVELDPAGRQRRLRRPAERRRRRAARLVLHARPEERAGGVAAIEGVRTPSQVAQLVMEHDRPSPARRQGRAGLRAQHGLQDRGRPQHRELAPACGWSGSAAPIRCTTLIAEGARRRRYRQVAMDMIARQADRSASTTTARSTATASARRARSAA